MKAQVKRVKICGNCGRDREQTLSGCACVPDWFWDEPAVARAVNTEDAGEVIRQLRRRVPSLTQWAIARMCGVHQSTVSRAGQGRPLTDPDVVSGVLHGLGAPAPGEPPPPAARTSTSPVQGPDETPLVDTELFTEFSHHAVASAHRLWRADLHQEDPLTWALTPADQLSAPVLRWIVAPPALLEANDQAPVHVGADDVKAITRACDLFEALDHEFGGGHARTAAVQYLNSEVTPLLQGNFTPEVGRSLFSAAARFAAKVGAMAYDAGLHALGRRYFLQSLNLAHLASDRLLGAKALALLSHQANFLGEHCTAVDFARTAKTGTQGHSTPAVQAMLAAMEARALASMGEERACSRALREMESAFSRVQRDDEPPWMGYFDASELSDELAHCFHDLGHGALAAEHANQSVELAPAGFRRSRSFAGLIHASAYLMNPGGADLEAACDTATGVLQEAGRLRSARVKAYLNRFHERLEPYAQTPVVKAFRDQLTEHSIGP
ncbi:MULTISPECIES: hypothetical protein [unclassified Nocardiopsis]|uniref:hypothetical protein n=1 Tax=unclassified Nocardiopsis TaxID=2649073 RepID=UPI001357984F|nr:MULTISPECIES: hypothetical protein [unclassified Nocardiopsis]